MHELAPRYGRVAVAYADCGTYGALDDVCARLAVPRLPGTDCYELFAGTERMRALLAAEPGTYVLTDFLATSFHRSVVVELGLATGAATGPRVVQVSSGGRFSCALADNGTVACWGLNAQSQLGRDDPTVSSPDLVQGLYHASRQAKELLMEDTAWAGIRPMMNAENDAEFAALQAGFRAGIPAEGPVDPESADRMLRVMGELGGEELVGQASSVPEGLFLDVTR